MFWFHRPMSRRGGGWRGMMCLAPAILLQFSFGLHAQTPAADAGPVDAAAMADAVNAAHMSAFSKDRYPSAKTCAGCHPTHYKQWSVSQHAYAQMSPIFNAMAGKTLQLTNGTNGDFCIRCHTQVGMNLGESEFMSNIDRHPTSREGISCVVCHRVNQAYGKLSGRFHLAEGPVTDPIYGPTGNPAELERIIQAGGVITDPNKAGRKIHGEVEKFFQITTSGFCGSCHDVTLVNGFRLEEAFSEYKGSPAAKAGVQCHDCHMGKEPGRILADKKDPEFDMKNYAFGPAAKVGAVETAPRKLTNHMFVGPDYSVLHPALFPLHPKIKEESEKEDPTVAGYTIRQWLTFNWKAGWGSDEFEDKVPEEYLDKAWDPSDTARPEQYRFIPPWDSIDNRYEGREVVIENLKLLKEMEQHRLTLLRTGYLLGDVDVEKVSDRGIEFRVQLRSGTDGHNVPTGFDAERLVWLFVRVMDADGKIVHQSGDVDPNGDLRDLHSAYVHNHELPQDKELLSLQGRFITRNVRGGEREQVLPVNYSTTPLPFLRPETQSSVLVGRPAGARKHKFSIEPNGERWGTYTVSRKELQGARPPLTAIIQVKAAMVPVNLVNEIRDVGFDYNMSARDVADVLVHGHIDANGEVVRWNPDSSDPEDNRVVGHQVVWERQVPLDREGVVSPEPGPSVVSP